MIYIFMMKESRHQGTWVWFQHEVGEFKERFKLLGEYAHSQRLGPCAEAKLDAPGETYREGLRELYRLELAGVGSC
jgi:hypothetical protein